MAPPIETSAGITNPTSSTPGSSAPSTSGTQEASRLSIGKSDPSLGAGRYVSPRGFEPSMVITDEDGWTSVHRASDGFDLGQTGGDGLMVAVAFLVPSEATADAALETVRLRASGSVTPVLSQVGGMDVAGPDVEDGAGELVVSADRGIGLDAAPGQRMRILAVDVDRRPLLVVVLVPDAAVWDEAWALADPVIRSISFG